PDFTPVLQYGLGFPGNFIQGFGNPGSSINNRPLAWFAQDSWKLRKNVTLNYGIRYDVELTKQVTPVGFTDPLSGIALSAADIQAAQDAVGVQQGFPRDKNNFAPRLGVAYDLRGDGKTVFRASYGLFYDHPLLAIAFNSDIAGKAQPVLLHRREVGRRERADGRERGEGRGGQAAEVVETGKVQLEERAHTDEVRVAAELEGVRAAHPSDVV